ncbi:MAG TPA: DUF4349 domain-containing protein [Anaerolineales bacterium]|nr:DUF4349 domain-containing protein [Anaerolineales bacterium]
MAEYNLFNKWRVKRKYFWLAVGLGVPALCVIVFGLLFVISPRMGSSANFAAYDGDLGFAAGEPAYDTADEGFFDDMEMEAPMEESRAQSIVSSGEIDKATASNGPVAVTERLIIREGNITIAVEKTRQTRDQIEDIVSEMAGQGAYVVSSSENGRGEELEPYVNITIRVPVEQFADVMDQIAAMGIEVAERYETSQDVTEEYVDIAGRIEATELSIEQLKEFMDDAEFTADLLEAERELYQRQAELEALKGRLNYLSESAALSIIHITLTPYELYEPIDTSWKPLATAKQAVEDLLNSMQGFADFMIVFGIAVLPWLVFFGLIIWGVVAVVRRRRTKKKAEQTE